MSKRIDPVRCPLPITAPGWPGALATPDQIRQPARRLARLKDDMPTTPHCQACFGGRCGAVIAAPSLGRCEQASAVLVGQRALPHANLAVLLKAAKYELNKATAPVSQAQETAARRRCR